MHFGYWKYQNIPDKGGYLYDGLIGTDWDGLTLVCTSVVLNFHTSLQLYHCLLFPPLLCFFTETLILYIFSSFTIYPLYINILHSFTSISESCWPFSHDILLLRMSTENQNVEEKHSLWDCTLSTSKDIKWRFQLQLKRHFLSLRPSWPQNSSPIKCTNAVKFLM